MKKVIAAGKTPVVPHMPWSQGSPEGVQINALIDAIGDEAFRRSPVTPDIILASLEAGGTRVHEQLTSNI